MKVRLRLWGLAAVFGLAPLIGNLLAKQIFGTSVDEVDVWLAGMIGFIAGVEWRSA